MFGIGANELFIIVVFALLIFGPDKLPKLGRTVGKFMREFNRAKDSMQNQIQSEMRLVEETFTPPSAEPASDKDEKAAEAPEEVEETEETEETEEPEAAADETEEEEEGE